MDNFLKRKCAQPTAERCETRLRVLFLIANVTLPPIPSWTPVPCSSFVWIPCFSSLLPFQLTFDQQPPSRCLLIVFNQYSQSVYVPSTFPQACPYLMSFFDTQLSIFYLLSSLSISFFLSHTDFRTNCSPFTHLTYRLALILWRILIAFQDCRAFQFHHQSHQQHKIATFPNASSTYHCAKAIHTDDWNILLSLVSLAFIHSTSLDDGMAYFFIPYIQFPSNGAW